MSALKFFALWIAWLVVDGERIVRGGPLKEAMAQPAKAFVTAFKKTTEFK